MHSARQLRTGGTPLRRPPRGQLLTLLAVLSAACDGATPPVAPAGAAGPARADLAVVTTHVRNVAPFSQDINLADFPGCAGPDAVLRLTATAVTQATTVADPATLPELQHFEIRTTFAGTAIGLTTGTVYRFRATFAGLFETPSLVAPQGVFIERIMVHLVAPGPGNDIRSTFLHHVLTLPSGEVKEFTKVADVQCVGG